jgi:predicted nucleotidyltransferase
MVENAEDIKKILRDEFPYLKNHFGIKRVGLFGSFANGTAKEYSDIDLLLEFDTPIGFKFMVLSEFLEKRLGRKVDLLTPDGLENVRVKHLAQNIKRSIIYV